MALEHPLTHRLVVAGPAGPTEFTLLKRSSGAADGEVFVVWHGITANNRFWFWDVLWQRGEVWLAGLPGHGPVHMPSQNIQTSWDAEHFIAVGEQLAALFAGRKLTLVGHSTGGLVALGVALRRPDLVKRLILVGSVVWPEFGGIVGFWQRFVNYPRLLHYVVAKTLQPGRKSIDVFKASLVAFVQQRRAFFANPHTQQAIRNGYPEYLRTPMNGISSTMFVIGHGDLRSAIVQQPYQGPCLIVHGMSDRVVPFKQAQWLAQHLPQSYLAPMPGIGHVPFGENEPLFNKWIIDWLDLHPLDSCS